jgi:heat shock protein HslJ
MIKVDANEVTGRGPCNYFRAGWSPETGPVGDVAHTLAGCPRDVLLDQEQLYFGMFQAAESVRVDDEEMTISGPEGDLVFRRQR